MIRFYKPLAMKINFAQKPYFISCDHISTATLYPAQAATSSDFEIIANIYTYLILVTTATNCGDVLFSSRRFFFPTENGKFIQRI